MSQKGKPTSKDLEPGGFLDSLPSAAALEKAMNEQAERIGRRMAESIERQILGIPPIPNDKGNK